MKVINIVETISELDKCIDFFSKVEVVKILTGITSKFGDEVVGNMFQTFSEFLYRRYRPPVEIEIFLVSDIMTEGVADQGRPWSPKNEKYIRAGYRLYRSG